MPSAAIRPKAGASSCTPKGHRSLDPPGFSSLAALIPGDWSAFADLHVFGLERGR
jgi:hypothetical protein